MTAKLKKVLIFGDSHSRAFKDVSISGYNINLNAISSASVLGLGNANSFLGVSKLIKKELSSKPETDFLVIKLGQVDIENIYLHKKYISISLGDLDSFLDRVFMAYSTFIDDLSKHIDINKIILWSVTPPSPMDKNTRGVIEEYFRSMTLRVSNKSQFIHIKKDTEFLRDLEYEQRLKRSKKFNSRLKALAKTKGVKYGEVFGELLDSDEKIKGHFEGYNYHIKGTDFREKLKPADPKVRQIFESALQKILP